MSADALWREIGPFGAVGDWHPLVEMVESDGETAGAHRTALTRDGIRRVERLQEMNPRLRRYRYAVESTPLPIRDCVAELRVDDNGDGSSTVLWASHFTVTAGDECDVVRAIRDFYRAGLDNLKRRYG